MSSCLKSQVAVILFGTVLTLVGCAHQSSKAGTLASSSSSACSGNVYLEKYHCSLETVQEAALSGNPDAQYALGYMYFNGIGTVKDEQTGILWIQRAASQGEPLAKKAEEMINNNKLDSSPEVTHQAAKPHPVTAARAVPATASASHAMVDPRLTSVKPSSPVSISSVGADVMTVNPKTYTLQLMGSYDKTAVENFVSRMSIANETIVYKASFHGKPWFTLIYGNYASVAEAKSAIANLPVSMKQLKPWVKSFGSIQAEIKNQQV